MSYTKSSLVTSIEEPPVTEAEAGDARTGLVLTSH